jgi:hypothetical protein
VIRLAAVPVSHMRFLNGLPLGGIGLRTLRTGFSIREKSMVRSHRGFSAWGEHHQQLSRLPAAW